MSKPSIDEVLTPKPEARPRIYAYVNSSLTPFLSLYLHPQRSDIHVLDKIKFVNSSLTPFLHCPGLRRTGWCG